MLFTFHSCNSLETRGYCICAINPDKPNNMENKQLNDENLYLDNPCGFRTYTGIIFDFKNPKP